MNSEISLGVWVIQPLSSSHNRAAFDCGVPEMNLYLKEHASQNAKKGIAQTFVAVHHDIRSPFFILGVLPLMSLLRDRS